MSKYDLDILKAKYELTKEEGKDRFTSYGAPILVSYAKYLIEYEEGKAKWKY